MAERTLRILVGKIGLDGHDRGAKIIARALRDAGYEVIYTGLHQTPEMIVSTAMQEDVDVIGLSILSGAHMHLLPKVLELLKQNGLENVQLIGGGIIPESDAVELQKVGVKAIFTPGTRIEEIVSFIRENVSHVN